MYSIKIHSDLFKTLFYKKGVLNNLYPNTKDFITVLKYNSYFNRACQ